MAPDPTSLDQRRLARVGLPSPSEPWLGLQLTCDSNTCQHTFGPDGPLSRSSRSPRFDKALVIAEQQKIGFRKLEDLPPWPKAQELAELQQRIEESTRQYETGQYSAGRYFSSLARMEAVEAELLREKRRYEQVQQHRRHTVLSVPGNHVFPSDRPDSFQG